MEDSSTIVGAMYCPWLPGSILVLALALAAPVIGQAPAEALETHPPVPADTEEAAPVEDAAAALYMRKCAGCHTFGGGALSGPDLKNANAFPRQTVWEAAKRMEKNVGPMSNEEIDWLTDLILSPDAGERLETQRELTQMREMATMEPGNAAIGRALYFGQRSFANGAISCGACHQAEGRGGNLATSLENAFPRLGEQPLMSTTEQPGFPVMRAIYEKQPVTKQEALHVVKFLEAVSENPAPPRAVPLHLAGLAGTVVVMVLLGKSTHKRAVGTRAHMVAEANRRSNRGRRHEGGKP